MHHAHWTERLPNFSHCDHTSLSMSGGPKSLPMSQCLRLGEGQVRLVYMTTSVGHTSGGAGWEEACQFWPYKHVHVDGCVRNGDNDSSDRR